METATCSRWVLPADSRVVGRPTCFLSRKPCRLVVHAVEKQRELPRESLPHFKRGLVWPQRLVAPETPLAPGGHARMTVYTLRISTASARGSALLEDAAGMQVCLVGKDGKSFLTRVSPLNDPEETEKQVIQICQRVDKGAGADCAVAVRVAGNARAHSRGPKPRFQEGSVDEVSFLGPELGPLAGLLIGPEAGSGWSLEEVNVSSSCSGTSERFVCRERLGERNNGAAFLRPVPPGAVVYGSGDTAVILSKEQAAALHAMGMLDYSALKLRLLLATAVLVLAGSGVTFSIGGWDAAAPFALGGTAGILYQLLLQQGVDAVPGAAEYSAARRPRSGPGSELAALLGSGGFRAAVVAVVTLGSVWAVQSLGFDANGDGITDVPGARITEMRTVMTGVLGFLMYKLAVVGVGSMPSREREGARALEKNA